MTESFPTTPHLKEAARPPFKFCRNLKGAALFFPPGVDAPVQISDITHNRGFKHEGRDLLILDTAGTIHPLWGWETVRMYWPALEQKTTQHADAEQPPTGAGAPR
ncbi:hypothetical protein ACWFMI_23780 [Nocardiopsis terrae]|uniref:hypothetical protein n=1 Tax=Streptomyces sp. NPDC057554 TaxID=3350538 RepID=UPI003699A5BC